MVALPNPTLEATANRLPVLARNGQNGHASYSLVAAAKRLDVSEIGVRRALKRKGQEWQDAAWGYFDTVPEIGFYGRYNGNMLSRLRLLAAYQPDGGADPIALDPDDEEQIAMGLAPIAEQAIAEVERLAGSGGDHGALTGPLAVGLSIPGEAYVIGTRDSSSPTGECWDVYSSDEIRVEESGVWLLRGPDDREGEPLDPAAVFIRIWNRHPRWRHLADSSMRSLLDPCEELSLLSQGIRAGATQRLSSGILLIPSELSFVQKVAGADEVSDPLQDPFLMTIVEAMSLPIQNPDAASAVIPLILRGPAEKLAEVRHMVIDRPYDELSMRQREELRKTIATGVDLPAEIILGLSDSNHWTAWAVDEQTYKAHLDAKALTICAGLTTEFLQPALMAAGFVPDRIIVWRDPSDLIADPDQWGRALDAHKEILISDKSARRAGGFDESDAPDPEEAAARAERSRPAVPGAPQSGPPGEPQDVQPSAPDEPVAEAATIVAAVRPRPRQLSRLATRLALIDSSLRARLQVRVDATVQRALEIAGGKVRRRVNGPLATIPNELLRARRKTLQESIRNMDHREICARLGVENVRALGLEDEDLIDDEVGQIDQTVPAAGSLAAYYLDQTSRAYQESRRLMLREFDATLSESDQDALAEKDRTNIAAGYAVLAAGVAAAIRSSLFQTGPTPPPQGEFAATAVPAGLVRESVAVAGGALSARPDPVTGRPSGGIATGEETTSLMAQMFGVTVGGGRWVYGDASARKQPFDLHEALDGQDFASWDDEVLRNPDSWPPVDFLFPGDHDYCQCDYIPALELGEPIGGGDETDLEE